MTSRNEYLTTARNVEFPGGRRDVCYALVTEHPDHETVGVAVEVKRAQELQREGVEYRPTSFVPADFTRWYGPDFPPLSR